MPDTKPCIASASVVSASIWRIREQRRQIAKKRDKRQLAEQQAWIAQVALVVELWQAGRNQSWHEEGRQLAGRVPWRWQGQERDDGGNEANAETKVAERELCQASPIDYSRWDHIGEEDDSDLASLCGEKDEEEEAEVEEEDEEEETAEEERFDPEEA